MNKCPDKPFTIYYGKELVKLTDPLEATAWYSNYKIDLLTGKRESSTPSELISFFNQLKLINSYSKTVIHLTYEMGFCNVFTHYEFPNDTLLAVVLIYKTKEKYNPGPGIPIALKRVQSPKKSDYKKAYERGKRFLLNGDCYQYNLTFPFVYRFGLISPQEMIHSFLSHQDMLGAYAHISWLPTLRKMILSNSPECLFQLRRKRNGFSCWTLPIKGSLAIRPGDKLPKLWRRLDRSKKNQAELFMITDLLRNDLSRIQRPIAKVIRKKCPLLVPGIYHQCSLVKTDLNLKISLGDILSKIFPGGSITGAPKKRVMEILLRLEKESRGLYTGSTIILDESVMAASINIRTAEVDFNNSLMRYQAGGGITLLSEMNDEYEEMKLKTESFLRLFR